MPHKLRIGIDLGGTKIEIVALKNQHILMRKRIATPQHSYSSTLHALASLIHECEHNVGPASQVGIGIPGTLSPDHGRIKNANSTCLNGHDLKHDLETLLARPISFANDTDCFTLSEARDGAGKGAETVFGVILGTGVGGGFVMHNQLLKGPNAIAGEWGHNPLPWRRAEDGPVQRCYCGKNDCIETFLSGPGWSARAGLGLSPQQLVAKAPFEPAAAKALELYCDQLARSLAGVINIIDPYVIVLGGGLSNITELYQQVPKQLPRYLFSDLVNTRLVPAERGDSSGVLGAAAWLTH